MLLRSPRPKVYIELRASPQLLPRTLRGAHQIMYVRGQCFRQIRDVRTGQLPPRVLARENCGRRHCFIELTNRYCAAVSDLLLWKDPVKSGLILSAISVAYGALHPASCLPFSCSNYHMTRPAQRALRTSILFQNPFRVYQSLRNSRSTTHCADPSVCTVVLEWMSWSLISTLAIVAQFAVVTSFLWAFLANLLSR